MLLLSFAYMSGQPGSQTTGAKCTATIGVSTRFEFTSAKLPDFNRKIRLSREKEDIGAFRVRYSTQKRPVCIWLLYIRHQLIQFVWHNLHSTPRVIDGNKSPVAGKLFDLSLIAQMG